MSQVATVLEGLLSLAAADGTETFPTPFLAVDLEAMERNLARMQRFFDGKPAALRPHVKTHKSTAIARMQVDLGSNGVTCSTTDEVTAMVSAGIGDVLLANVVTDAVRLRALARDARDAHVAVALDSERAARLLSEAAQEARATIGALVDCDIGMRRNGVSSVADGLDLADVIASLPGLEVRGVMAYEGHLVDLADRSRRAAAVRSAFEMPIRLLERLRSRGFDAPVLTGGSTSTYDVVGSLADMSEVQAGTYALMDGTYAALAPEFEMAAGVVVTVLTSEPRGRVIVNAGAKRLSTDWGEPQLLGYDVRFEYLAEEHGVFVSSSESPAVGERVVVVPGHICSTVNLYNRLSACRKGVLEKLLSIDARDPLM